MARICAVCGKPVYAGMTDDDFSFYAHEGKCFFDYMDEEYGVHKWMELDSEDEFGGYYLAAADTETGYMGTGIYYTEWDDENEII